MGETVLWLALERYHTLYGDECKFGGRVIREGMGQSAGVGAAGVLDFVITNALAERLAEAVKAHATPVGSGTVARTERIPVGDRAEAAVIVWKRHRTTDNDLRVIPRVKGQCGEVRRLPARRSHDLLKRYRRGLVPSVACPLQQALAGTA